MEIQDRIAKLNLKEGINQTKEKKEKEARLHPILNYFA
jgi:hypothetical protein